MSLGSALNFLKNMALALLVPKGWAGPSTPPSICTTVMSFLTDMPLTLKIGGMMPPGRITIKCPASLVSYSIPHRTVKSMAAALLPPPDMNHFLYPLYESWSVTSIPSNPFSFKSSMYLSRGTFASIEPAFVWQCISSFIFGHFLTM